MNESFNTILIHGMNMLLHPFPKNQIQLPKPSLFAPIYQSASHIQGRKVFKKKIKIERPPSKLNFDKEIKAQEYDYIKKRNKGEPVT